MLRSRNNDCIFQPCPLWEWGADALKRKIDNNQDICNYAEFCTAMMRKLLVLGTHYNPKSGIIVPSVSLSIYKCVFLLLLDPSRVVPFL